MKKIVYYSVLAGFLSSFGALSARAQTVWSMPTEYPATAMPGEGVTTFAEAIAKRLPGKLVIKPSYNAESGFKSADLPGAVAGGKVQAADAFSGAMGKLDPAFELASLPFLASTLEDARRLAGEARPYYEKAFAARGLKLLYTTPWPPSGIWSKAPVANADALNKLAIRTYDANSLAVFKAAGADAANLSFKDVMPRLKDGSIVAVLSSGDGGAGRKLWEYLPNFTAVNYAVPLSFAFVQREAFEALPEADRKAVMEAAQETEARQWKAIEGRLERNYATMRANGVAIVTAAPADVSARLRTAASAVIDAWAAKAGDDGKAILAKARKP